MFAIPKLALVLCLLFALFCAPADSRPLRGAHKRCVKRLNNDLSTLHTSEPTNDNNQLIATASVESAEPAPTASNEEPKEQEEPKEDKPESKDNSNDSQDSEDSNDSEGSSQGGSSADASALFPLGRTGQSWTTCSALNDARPLSDGTLRPTKDMKSLSHNVVPAPDGSDAMEAFYPKGSMNPGNSPQGGFSFYAQGPSDINLDSAKEVTFGYSVFFEQGFDWVRGGKLPGIYGGNSADGAVSCSGGRRDNGCFSARLMWRAGGEGEFYTYLPPSFGANDKVCNVKPSSHCNSKYGASVGRGALHFQDGQWNTVAERVKLNDAGQENGEIELYANGRSVIKVTGLVLRDSNAGKIRGVQMQTFFGGSSDGFQAHKDSKVWFKDLSLAITETF